MRRFLPAVFIIVTGFSTTFVEVLAVRVLAPYFGATTLLWSVMIGAVIGGLSVGNYVGGVLSERRANSGKVFPALAAGIGVWIAALPWLVRLAAPPAGFGPWGIVLFALDVLAFSLPAIGLGAVGTISLDAFAKFAGGGSRALGKGLALSAVGALLGAILPYAYFIPYWGSTRSLALCGILWLALAAFGRRAVLGMMVLALGCGLISAEPMAYPPPFVEGRVLSQQESRHALVRVVEHTSGTRLLVFDEGMFAQSRGGLGSGTQNDVWGYMAAAALLGYAEPRSILILGLGAGSSAWELSRMAPWLSVVGVEIDPVVIEAGREYFRLSDLEESGFLRIIVSDARRFVQEDRNQYDAILLDAYRPPYVPFHLATREFFGSVRKRLKTGGVVVVNVAHAGEDQRLVRAFGSTIARVFPSVYGLPVPGGNNTLIIAAASPIRDPEDSAPTEAFDTAPRIVDDVRHRVEPMESDGTPWTDDRAPVEWVTDRMLLARFMRPPS